MDPNWELLQQCVQTAADNDVDGMFCFFCYEQPTGELDFYLDHHFVTEDAMWATVASMELWIEKVRAEHGEG